MIDVLLDLLEYVLLHVLLVVFEQAFDEIDVRHNGLGRGPGRSWVRQLRVVISLDLCTIDNLLGTQQNADSLHAELHQGWRRGEGLQLIDIRFG